MSVSSGSHSWRISYFEYRKIIPELHSMQYNPSLTFICGALVEFVLLHHDGYSVACWMCLVGLYTHSFWNSLEHPAEGPVENRFMYFKLCGGWWRPSLEAIQQELRGSSGAPLLGMFTEFSKAKCKGDLLLNVSLPLRGSPVFRKGLRQGGGRSWVLGNEDFPECQCYLPPLFALYKREHLICSLHWLQDWGAQTILSIVRNRW